MSDATQTAAPTTTQTRPNPSTSRPSSSSGSSSVQRKVAASMAGDFDAQEAALAPVQRHGGGGGDGGVHAAAAHGISGSGGAMPFQSRIQKSFGGYDIGHVQAHTDRAAQEGSAAMGANAFATGSHVAFGKSPDLHTAAHEAAHVIQQKGGVSLSGGVGAVGDRYEQHADAVADRVVAGESAADLLSQYAGGGGGSGVQRQAVQKDANQAPPTSQQTTSPQQGTPPQQGTTPQQGQDPAPQLTVTHGESVAFEFGLQIPVYGPVKLDGKVAGSYTQKEGTGGPQTEVEGTLYGGLLVDLWLFKLKAGVEGKVKFTINEHTDLITAVKRGINEIVAWKMAQDYVPRLRQLKSTVSTVYQSRLSGVTRHMGRMMEAIEAGNWAEQAGETSTIWKLLGYTTEREWILWYADDVASHLGGQFADLGAELQEDKVINVAGATAKLNAIRDAPTKEAARAANQEMMAYVVGEFQRSEQAVASAVDSVQMVSNDPAVGFEASVAFKAGASVQATPGLSGEVEVAFVNAIQDEAGQTQWNHETQESTVVTGKVSAAGWEIQLTGDFKETEVEVGLGFTGKRLSTSPEAAEHSIQSVAQAVRGAQSGLQMLSSPLQTARTAANTIGEVISSEAAKFASPDEIANRRSGSTTGEASLGFEVKMKFDKDPFRAKGGGITIKLVDFKVSAEQGLGAAAAVGVSGSMEHSHTFEVSYG